MSEIQKIDDVSLIKLDQFSGSLANRVYESLKQSIISLELQPNLVLRKKTICDQFLVSRAPVAEAIARLAAEGLVEVIPQSGSKVSRLSMADIREGAFLREAVELAAVEKVAIERSAEQLTRLQQNLKLQYQFSDASDFKGFYLADEAMHEMIMGFTGFDNIANVAATAWLQVNRARQLILPTAGRAQESVEEHELIIRAIAQQDPVMARAAMKNHLGNLIKRLAPLELEQPHLFSKT